MAAGRALIVDDELVIQHLLAEVLRDDGFEVEIAGSAREARERLDALGDLDVALIDKNLPDGSGIDVVRLVKERAPRAEVILITGYASFDSAIEAMRIGVFDYVLKPFDDINELRLRVRNAAGKRRLQDQVIQAQRLEAVGRLAGGIAHDFNNLLVVIMSCAQMLERKIAAGAGADELLGYARQISAAGGSATALTKQLLAVSRRQVIAPTLIDLNAALDEIRAMLGRALGEDIVLATELAPDVPQVRIDRGQLEQLVLNLTVNARDAMPRGGTVTLATERVDRDGRPHARLCVRDTGTGIPDDVRDRVFEPFFTTKDAEQGTGLGLATVQAIVVGAGGVIELQSSVGAGTSFAIDLPAAARAADEVPDVVTADEAAGGSETLLLVDDDPLVRELAARMLREAGYRILEAAGRRAARELFDDHGDDISLVVIDLRLPDGAGSVLLDDLRADRPSLRALYVSGYAADLIRITEESGAYAPVLPKPYTERSLLKAIRAALDE